MEDLHIPELTQSRLAANSQAASRLAWQWDDHSPPVRSGAWTAAEHSDPFRLLQTVHVVHAAAVARPEPPILKASASEKHLAARIFKKLKRPQHNLPSARYHTPESEALVPIQVFRGVLTTTKADAPAIFHASNTAKKQELLAALTGVTSHNISKYSSLLA